MTRVAVAKRAGIDAARLANYEHGRVAIPYHIAAKVVEALEVCQRWLATGREPRRGNIAVAAGIESLIPKSMSFVEAYDLFLGGFIDERLSKEAEFHSIDVEHLGRETLVLMPEIGAAQRGPARCSTLDAIKSLLALLVDRLPPTKLGPLMKDVKRVYDKYQPHTLLPSELRDETVDARELARLSGIASERIKTWLPPGHARRAKQGK